jgi:hypothetical protein
MPCQCDRVEKLNIPDSDPFCNNRNVGDRTTLVGAILHYLDDAHFLGLLEPRLFPSP